MLLEIIKLLENKKLRETVVKTIKEVYDYAFGVNLSPDHDMNEDLSGKELWNEAWMRGENHGEIDRIKVAFEKYVFSKMKHPRIIYPDEILFEFYQLMCPGGTSCPEYDGIDYDDLYTVFIARIKLDVISHRRSEPLRICIVSDYQREFTEGLIKGLDAGRDSHEESKRILVEEIEKINDPLPVLWQYKDLKVCLAKKVPIGLRYVEEEAYLTAIVEGPMSRKTLASMQSSLPEVLQTAIRTLSLLYGEKVKVYTHGLPVVNESVLHENRDTIRAFLDSFYAQTAKASKSKKDKNFDRRIRNSVLLLIESDRQNDDAIGLALAVSSIEALLGETGSELSEKLSLDVATLLEPEVEKRGAAAVFVKDIYNLRSEALHGKQLDGKSSSRLQARHLASAIFLAIISHLNLQKRLGETPPNPQILIQNLRKSRFKKGQAVEYNVKKYWA